MLLWSAAASACGAREHEKEPRHLHGSGATLLGTVRLKLGTELPSYDLEDLEREPRDPAPVLARPAACEAADARARQPIQMGDGRGLSGVVVGASGFTNFLDRKSVTHRVRIEACALSPPLVAGMDGDELVVENADTAVFTPLFGVRVDARALAPGKTMKFPLVGGGIESIMCTKELRCGRSDVVVFNHPVYAVTQADGAFRIDNFPTGQAVHVSAWHPLLMEGSAAVWLEPGERRAVELVVEPRVLAGTREAH